MNIKRSMGTVSNTTNPNPHPESRVVAVFGTGRLVRRSDGRHELAGGTAANAAEAREWCSLFAHDIVFSTDHAGINSSPARGRATPRLNAGAPCTRWRHPKKGR